MKKKIIKETKLMRVRTSTVDLIIELAEIEDKSRVAIVAEAIEKYKIIKEREREILKKRLFT